MASSTPTPAARAAPPKSAYFENDVEFAVDDAPETPRAMLERRPEGVYTVGIARRARSERDDGDDARGAPDVARAFALEDEDAADEETREKDAKRKRWMLTLHPEFGRLLRRCRDDGSDITL